MAGLRVLYLAVGDNRQLHEQALYAAMSALAWGGHDTRVLLYTDRPERYARLAGCIGIEPVPRPLAEKYLAPAFEPFELKLAILGYAAKTYPQQALLFCDADTFFTQSYADLAAQLESGSFFLHRREYSVAGHPTPQMRKFRRALAKAGLSGETDKSSMWNSGVIGLPPGPRAADVIRHAHEIFARLSAHTPKRYLAEQFSLSLEMDRGEELHAAEDWVFHYWFQKADYASRIERFLSLYESSPLDDVLAQLRQERISLPAPAQKLHWWERALIGAGLRSRPREIRGLPKEEGGAEAPPCL